MLIPLLYSIAQYGFFQLVSVQDAPLDTQLACRCISLVLCWRFSVWSVLMFSVYLGHFMAHILIKKISVDLNEQPRFCVQMFLD